ncbi:MAG: two-component system response regulator [Candidatus Cloacimonetes bacterium HGW-Cloacimonetes-2]|jgi:putative nucleotidyltransferase with HDIG domain|nr:MAG: two-component system response regulator [Candidatus Cloacimonetes bacterium HGW-Cloacimonetes-2]
MYKPYSDNFDNLDTESGVYRKILIIEDDLSMLRCVQTMLRELPLTEVLTTSSPEDALNILSSEPISVVVSDICMPGYSGIDLLERIYKFNPNIQVILMTGMMEASVMRRAIQLNAFDFLRKPFEAAELMLTVKQALNKNQLLVQNTLYQNKLEMLVEKRTVELLQAKSQLETHYLNAINSMINAIEVSDVYTVGHSERVTTISLLLGRLLKLDAEELRYLRIGAMLHDLGKIGRINALVTKNHRLSRDEYDQIKQHPVHGAKIISPLGLPKAVNDIILQHHERQDGTGYPYGIKGDKISSYAKIVSVADSYDAMTSRRAYRTNLEPRAAAEELLENSGTQFDPIVVRTFYREFDLILKTISSKTSLNEELFSSI